MPKAPVYRVYILECADATLYTGITTDLKRRVAEHNSGKVGAKYTKTRRPVQLRYSEKKKTRSAALIREAALKRLTRQEKLLLLQKGIVPAMKTWTLKFRQVDKARFEEIRSGKKEIETRAATVKYQPIIEGDSIIFTCGKEKFTKEISKKHHFKTVDSMLKKIPLKKIMPDVKTVEEAQKRYVSYPGYKEKIREHGIFAFEFEK
jgi:putative endonuclease